MPHHQDHQLSFSDTGSSEGTTTIQTGSSAQAGEEEASSSSSTTTASSSHLISLADLSSHHSKGKTGETTHRRRSRARDKVPDPYEEYFTQQSKLFRHLEKRYIKFQKTSKEEQARARKNRSAKNNNNNTVPAVRNVRQKEKQSVTSNKRNSKIDNKSANTLVTASTSKDPNTNTDTGNMIGSSLAVVRSTVGRGVSQIARPAISITAATSPASSASFSSTASTSIRSQKLKTKKKKNAVNPDAMTATEAARVLRALEIANPTSSYSLTLSTKSTKSSLPIRGHFQLPLDPRRSSETILVFAEPNSPSSNLAKAAGAAYVGGDELFESVLSGKISPTRCLATPGMMPQVTRNLARYLGPKGLMPVAKRGLVGEGEELAEKIRDAAGRMEYRADKEGLVRIPVARMDFEIPSIENNIRSFIQSVRDDQSAGNTDDALTAAAKKKKKGSSITAVKLETTNGPSIEISDVL
ncbi:uncharacterized protein IL334_007815 [Kwoniella shivajii]|uniref:Ribosomal protein n=1 Tax=Kwoniella shivajii TaxID=564305 RepID=A0ABZ1DAI0_9TREE|nr:hypothetical protein IL334_007815 [Kwoniella shivajii]